MNNSVAWAMLVFVALALGINTLNAIFQFEGLLVATDSVSAAAFGAAGSNALVLLLLESALRDPEHTQVFCRMWLAPLGDLVCRSGQFSKALGVILVAVSFHYLVDLLAAILFQDFGKLIYSFMVIVFVIAEV